MKRFFKILFGVILIALLLIVGGVSWLFSKNGNAFLQDKITQIANQRAPIGLVFTEFKLGINSYAFTITDKQESQIAIQGEYSLLGLDTIAQIQASIKDLAPYEKLLGMRLNGGIELRGNLLKHSKTLGIKADISAFNSTLFTDITLEDFKPKRLFVDGKNGIDLEALLTFLNQPKYANGRILFNADMDLTNLQEPNGGFSVASDAIMPNSKLLAQTYGITLPKDPLQLVIQGTTEHNNVTAKLLLLSSYLNVESQNLQANLMDFSSNGDINIQLKDISIKDLMLKTPLLATLHLQSSSLADQEATFILNLLTNPILAHLIMPHYTPQQITLQAQDLSLRALKQLASSYANLKDYSLDGTLNFHALLDKIQLSPLHYTINAKLQSNVASLSYQNVEIAKNNAVFVEIHGNAKDLKTSMTSDLFDAQLLANLQLHNTLPTSLQATIESLNLQKFAKLLGYNAQGVFNAKVNVKSFEHSTFDADIDIQSPKILLTKQLLNSLSGLEFKNDLNFALKGSGTLKDGKGHAMLNLDSKELQIQIPHASMDINNALYAANFAFSTPEIATINPLALPLKGAILLQGSASFADNKPSIMLQNKDFGNLELSFKDQRLRVVGEDLDLRKLADFSGNGQYIKGGIAHLNADLMLQGQDAKTLIKNLSGNVELRTRDLEIYSLDIDALARGYENANTMNLLDIGALVLAGPLGLAATKGSNAGIMGLNAMIDSKTLIPELVANLSLDNGVAHAQDVAFATTKTRLAAIGAINLNNNAFEDFSIGLLDKNNCAQYSQSITGTLDNPEIAITHTTIQTAVNLATSALRRLKKGTQAINEHILLRENKTCKPFYNGSVKHPQ